jgi:hypothetical protein
MTKQFLGIVVLVMAMSACGDGPVVSRTTLTPASTTTPPTESEGGFGSPAQAEGEFAFAGSARPVRGELQLTEDGCWYVDFDGPTHLVVFPVGFEIPASDATLIVAPDETSFNAGSMIDGEAHEVRFEDAPGGDAGRWWNYIAFCEPQEHSLAVFETMDPAFDPVALGDEQVEAMVADAVFTKSWPCGRGWAASTEDELVGIFIYQQSPVDVETGAPIGLPDDAWSAEVVVGKHLFVNHCDDVLEPWEPNPVVGGQWQLTSGTLEVLDDLPAAAETGPVRAVVSDAAVTTERGAAIAIGRIELLNSAFNMFAG